MFKKVALLALVALGCGCGGPEFSVSYRFIPPQGGGSCLKACEEKLSDCNSRCAERRERCLERAREEAKEVYAKELEAYKGELLAYQRAYSAYQRELLNWNRSYRELYRDYIYFKERCKKGKDYLVCRRADELEEALETLNQVKPQPPRRPVKPELSEVIRELSLTCPSDCGCRDEYEACFTSCGGKIIPERICVKNCN